MAWYVASLRDGDTHLGSEVNGGKVNGVEVRAPCGQTFRPLTRLTGEPPDPLQVCQACLTDTQDTSGGHAVHRRRTRGAPRGAP